MNTNLRKLVYVPVLHARENSLPAVLRPALQAGGQAASILHGNEKSGIKDKEFNADHSAVGEMWAGITAKIEELGLPWNKTRIYQDGLPGLRQRIRNSSLPAVIFSDLIVGRR